MSNPAWRGRSRPDWRSESPFSASSSKRSAHRCAPVFADLFKLQDQVVARLASTLGYELVTAEARRLDDVERIGSGHQDVAEQFVRIKRDRREHLLETLGSELILRAGRALRRGGALLGWLNFRREGTLRFGRRLRSGRCRSQDCGKRCAGERLDQRVSHNPSLLSLP